MRWGRVTAVLGALLLSGCAGAPIACAPGTNPTTRLELFFGRNVMGREVVSDEDWRKFLDEEVTRRFPDGFTVIDTYGQWRNAGGSIAMERGKELIVIAQASADEAARIGAIRDAFKRRFMQESVLFAQSPACAAF
jgi:hypothetical protein